ncbi:MAG: NuoF family protein [Candidatus Limnocylindrales bacterium]|jgi:NADH:ubiquinone oxidoreductase subunit F (NADH-binding)/(2Fe-2S) ferredoxin
MARLTVAGLEARGRVEAPVSDKPKIKVGMSTCGMAAGAEPVFVALEAELKGRSLDWRIARTGCAGMCSMEPLVEVQLPGQPAVMFGEVTPEFARQVVAACAESRPLPSENRVPGIADLARIAGEPVATEGGPRQYRIVMRNCGVIDPEAIDEYLDRGGYQALAKVLSTMTPEQVIEELKVSGVRGRGGAGFPAWLKWNLTRESKGEEHLIVCNGDEGDPGAYMDRSVLEGDPHAVLEGMIIGGYVIGATSGFFYIRAEYPLAIERIEKAIRQARAAGLLGNNILGTNFSFNVEIRLGAGAFVCGEETALIASVEGKRGTPSPRPPYPSVKGLWGQPTMINNVESLANMAQIILRGGKWFAGIGLGKSTGTKVFAVTGKVKHAGLVEIPMGMTLREVVEGICGGSATGSPIKAVQTGGPSGGLIPASELDTPITYEHLQKLGSYMGSGGMIVMDETDDLVELSRFYLGFCVDESCGKCAPCRIGGTQMLRLLDKIAAGKGNEADIATIRRLAHAMQKASLCGLGQGAPNPVLSALRYLEPEFRGRLTSGRN